MDNDIFFLGNNDYLKFKEKNKDQEKIKNFINNDKNDIISFFNDCLINNFKNKDIEKSFYNYVNSILKYKSENDIKNIEIDDITELNKEQFYILNKAFINLKKNRQKNIMKMFEQRKTVKLFNNDKNKKIIINQSKVDKEIIKDKQNIEDKKNKKEIKQKTEKTLDLTNKI